MIRNILIILISAAYFTSSCGDGSKGTENTGTSQSDTIRVDNDEDDEDELIIFIPPPVELLSVLSEVGVKYRQGTLFPIDKKDQFNTAFKKYLVLGAYSADMAYCVLQNQNQKSLEYMNATNDLSEELGLNSMTQMRNYVERYEENIGNNDSLQQLINEFLESNDAFYEDNNIMHISYIVYAGAWLESMNVGINSITSFDEEALSYRLSEQINILSDIIRLLENKKNKYPELPWLIENLNNIQSKYVNSTGIDQEETLVNFKILNEKELSEIAKVIRNTHEEVFSIE
ncbi:MAG TPA: hypothetical protein DDX92_12040 [Flavobacteriales bacterium]|jgi:hypothetical protein|nr:hypothetical protein [Flavobacteriales bacterium]